MNHQSTCRPVLTIFDAEDPLAERLVRLGLTKAKLDEKDPDETFVFPLQLRGRRALAPEQANEITVAMQVLDVIRRQGSERDVTPEMVANWLSEQAVRMERDLWLRTARCIRRLVWWHLPTNIGAWDLRRLASLVDLPESLYDRSRRFQQELDFLVTMRINEVSLMALFGIDGERGEVLMYNVDDALMS